MACYAALGPDRRAGGGGRHPLGGVLLLAREGWAAVVQMLLPGTDTAASQIVTRALYILYGTIA